MSHVLNVLPHSQTPSDCLWRPDLFPPPADTREERQKETGLETVTAANLITHSFAERDGSFHRASLRVQRWDLPAWPRSRRSSCYTKAQLLCSPLFSLMSFFCVIVVCAGWKSSPPQKQLSLCCFRDGLSCQNVEQQKLFRESRARGLHLSKRPELVWSSATVW